MNERIQALMEQAMELVDPYALEGEFGPRRLNEEKFAELLIRECAGLVQGVPTDTMGYHTADQKIKTHFGVEE